MKLLKRTNKTLEQFLPELIELRRHFHAHPELSGQEHQTAALIAGELRRYGWRVQEAVGRTGIVAELGSTKGPLLGVRVDMDALPVEELTGLDFSSRTQGFMHACGHDLHICIGLGLARLLAANKSLKTGIRLIFQPAEEIAEGARWMRQDGATKDLNVLFGVHAYPDLKVGEIGVRSGGLTAAAAQLEIEVIGKGGHGARPHQAVDPIWIASKIISGLQEAISRQLDALSPVVLSFGKIEGGQAFNVIAERVQLLGTVRYLDEKLHDKLPIWIEKTVQAIANSFGAEVNVSYRPIAPIVFNDPELTTFLENCSIPLLGKENIQHLDQPSLGAEDFAELLQDVPGTMFRLGVAGDEGCAPLHSGYFSLDERSLQIGIEVLFATICSWMQSQNEISMKNQ